MTSNWNQANSVALIFSSWREEGMFMFWSIEHLLKAANANHCFLSEHWQHKFSCKYLLECYHIIFCKSELRVRWQITFWLNSWQFSIFHPQTILVMCKRCQGGVTLISWRRKSEYGRKYKYSNENLDFVLLQESRLACVSSAGQFWGDWLRG